MRINKYLALCGIGSRRACDRFIQEGKIQKNGEPVQNVGIVIDTRIDRITFEGREVHPLRKRYFVFYKPIGVLTTNSDPYARAHLITFLEDVEERLFAVGRLDSDSEGLLLLTNDGDIAHMLQHPKYKVAKVYWVQVDSELSLQQERAFEGGILLEEGRTAPARIRRIGDKEYEIILKQGWNRQIRRMLEVLGVQVRSLKRVAIGPFCLGNLKPGEKKEIAPEIFHSQLKKN